jgi:hypothetical protein
MQFFTGCTALITDLSFSISACCPTSAKQRKPPARIVYTSSLYLRQNRQWCSNTSTSVCDPSTWHEYDELCNSDQANSTQLQHVFQRTLFLAAIKAGYRVRVIGYPQQDIKPIPSKFKVWHDSECKALKAKAKALNRAKAHLTAAEEAELTHINREYRRRVKDLLRKHILAVAKETCRQWRIDRNAFWLAYRKQSTACPHPPTAVAKHFCQTLNKYVTTDAPMVAATAETTPTATAAPTPAAPTPTPPAAIAKAGIPCRPPMTALHVGIWLQ